MNDRAAVPHPLLLRRSPADLAHEPDFRLGRSLVRPSVLQLQRDGQPAQSLEPRVMQVLVVLAQARGAVVSRSDLIDRCWDGRVVGDNAINRVISRLRQLAAGHDGGDFEIETISRVGYRLQPVRVLAAGPAEPKPPTGGDAQEVLAAGDALEAPAGDALEAPAGAGQQAPASAGAPAAPRPALAQPLARRRWLHAALGGAIAAGLGGAGWFAWQRAGPVRASLDGARLAVLPFATPPEQEGDKLLGVGMADSLTTRLSTTNGLVVRAAGSALRFGGAQHDPMLAARSLGADWIVDGTLRRDGERLYVTARLLRAGDGVAVWSDRFDTPLGGIFDVQDLISARVVRALAAALNSPLSAAPANGGTVGGTRNAEAYQLYLAAIWRGQGHRREDLDRALQLLDQALALDPGFAMAWTAIAWTHRRGLWIDTRPAEVFAPAQAALERAAAIAPGLAEMLAGRGFTRYYHEYDWAAAERDFRAALAINPNVAVAHFGLAQLQLTQDRIAEGLVHLRHAVELDPMSPVFSVVEASYLLDLGRLAEAQRRLDAGLALAPNLYPMHELLGKLRLAQGRADEGIAALRQAAALGGGASRPQAVLGFHLAAVGQGAETRLLLDALEARSRVRFVPPTSIAALHAALGQTGPALDALEQAMVVRDVRLIFLKDDPFWRGLRQEPRFVALMKRLGLDRFGPGLAQV